MVLFARRDVLPVVTMIRARMCRAANASDVVPAVKPDALFHWQRVTTQVVAREVGVDSGVRGRFADLVNRLWFRRSSNA